MSLFYVPPPEPGPDGLIHPDSFDECHHWFLSRLSTGAVWEVGPEQDDGDKPPLRMLLTGGGFMRIRGEVAVRMVSRRFSYTAASGVRLAVRAVPVFSEIEFETDSAFLRRPSSRTKARIAFDIQHPVVVRYSALQRYVGSIPEAWHGDIFRHLEWKQEWRRKLDATRERLEKAGRPIPIHLDERETYPSPEARVFHERLRESLKPFVLRESKMSLPPPVVELRYIEIPPEVYERIRGTYRRSTLKVVWFVSTRFEPGRSYAPAAVDRMIARACSRLDEGTCDIPLIRAALCKLGFLHRAPDGSRYWKGEVPEERRRV